MKEQIVINKGSRIIEASLWSEPTYEKVLIVAPAIGVSRHFYKRIAEHFHSSAYNVLSFDYPLKDDMPVRLADWGYKDIPSVIDYVQNQFAGQPIYFLGHSMAGQLFPLAENNHQVEAACFVATQNVAEVNWNGFSRLKVGFFWRAIIPFFTNFLGHLPGYAYGGINLPKSIARDWRSWGLNKKGLQGYIPEAKKDYDRIEVPVKFISFSDDDIAPPKSAAKIFETYGTKEKIHEHLTPQQLGLKSLGHFNFFRSSFSHLWPKVEEWFETSNYSTSNSSVTK